MTSPARRIAARLTRHALAGVNYLLTITVSIVVIVIAILLFVALVDGGEPPTEGPSTSVTRR